jgi:hypothetical protein
MIKYNKELIDSVYNKRTEIHYNEWYIKTDFSETKIELKGKIKCPVLNTNISSLVCSRLMDKEDWPRGIDREVCKKCDCFISVSISKFQSMKPKEPTSEQKS